MFGSIGAGLRIVTVAEKTGPVASFQTAEDGRRVRLRERAEAGPHPSAGWLQEIAESTEYEWQQDPTRDPFVRFLNKKNAGELLRRMGRG